MTAAEPSTRTSVMPFDRIGQPLAEFRAPHRSVDAAAGTVPTPTTNAAAPTPARKPRRPN
ncbi:hypothetical protein Aglo01_32770 [Actinokineospora globicatena]|nr:hypothetical protein Aglo01_32770 [Actinokineospora globicatena]